MLGHFDAGFTLRTYTHVTRQMQESAAEKMGNFMAQVMWTSSKKHRASERIPSISSPTLSGHFAVWVTVWVRRFWHLKIRTNKRENRRKSYDFHRFLELVAGLEPATCWLRISCSTDWATLASRFSLSIIAYLFESVNPFLKGERQIVQTENRWLKIDEKIQRMCQIIYTFLLVFYGI